jgi:predicted transcriptional regulator
MRDFKVAIKSLEESNKETTVLFRQFDNGVFPDQPIERIYFHDVQTFLKYITPRRFELLERLRQNGATSIRALSKLLLRNYKNVYDDVKLLEQIGLVEKDAAGLYCVPWDEVSASFRKLGTLPSFLFRTPRFLWFEYLVQPKFQHVNEGLRSKKPSGVSGLADGAIHFFIFKGYKFPN